MRHGENPDDDLVVLINFAVATHNDFRIGVPREGTYQEIFNSDAPEFGGSGYLNEGVLVSEDTPWNGREESLVLHVPPLGGTVLKRTGPAPRKPKKKAAHASTKAKVAPKHAAKGHAAD